VIPKVGNRLLEVGCGVGDFLMAAKKEGWEVEGIDLSSTAIEASVRLHGLPVRQGKLEDLDFDKHSYKAVVCWEVLEHLVYPWRFLQKIKEVLTPDGIFACSIPNYGPRVPCFRDGPLGIASIPPIHLNFWDCNSFRFFAELNDFKVLYLAPKRSLLDLVGWRNHLVRFMWNQLLAVCGLKEGMNIFALLTPNKN
jgi:SAM-dependent methyltransferase